jgi:opacity protein-like surface antigen
MFKLVSTGVIILISTITLCAQSHNWSGFYVGANIYASRDDINGPDANFAIQQISNLFVTGRGIVVVPGTTRPQTTSGDETNWGGGGHVGYQWQSGNLVFGPEFEFDPSHRTISFLDKTTLPFTILQPDTVVVMAQQEYKLSQDMSLRGRIGYAFGGGSLIYGTGGYANTNVQITTVGTFTNPGGLAAPCSSGPPTGPDGGVPCTRFNSGPEGPVVTTSTGEQRKGGWTFGGGFAQSIANHLSLGAEYRHTSLGNTDNFAMTGSTVNTGPETHGTNGGTGTLGMVSPLAGNSKLKSDSVNFRIDFHF